MLKKIILLLFLALINETAFCATPEIVKKMQDFYKKNTSFSAEFTQNLEHKESGAKESRKGKLLFRKPFAVYWETFQPNAEILVLNDNEIWDYLPDEELAYRYSADLARDSRNIIQVLTGQSEMEKNFSVTDAGMENGKKALVLYPHEPTTQMVEARIWVEPETGRIQRVRIIDFYGNANDVRLGNIHDEVKFSANTFKFVPPKNVEIEDRTQPGAVQKELFK